MIIIVIICMLVYWIVYKQYTGRGGNRFQETHRRIALDDGNIIQDSGRAFLLSFFNARLLGYEPELYDYIYIYVF